jgi:hypothetical protein
MLSFMGQGLITVSWRRGKQNVRADGIYYKRLLEERIADAFYNWEYYEKKSREAEAVYKAAMKEREAYDKAIDKMMDSLEGAI